jgi:hypothetical protein
MSQKCQQTTSQAWPDMIEAVNHSELFMHRIYFDTNEGVEGGYGLWLDASKKDLNRIPNGPKNGMHIVIYMTGELEMEAVLRFMPEHARG